MDLRQIKIIQKDWPVDGSFRISRSQLKHIPVLSVEIYENGKKGQAECRPYARYRETQASVTAQIETLRADIESGLTLEGLQTRLPAGAARNVLDCALWDLKAKQENRPVWDMLNLPAPRPRITAYTVSMDTPSHMAKAAIAAKDYPLLKIKIGGDAAIPAVLAVLEARPDAELILDANEALTPSQTAELQNILKHTSTLLIEQPLPAQDFSNLPPHKPGDITICADESLHTIDDLEKLWTAGYRAVNVKLDKCGGLSAGLDLMQAAKDKGFDIMAGCMVGSSLAMAPMMMLESFAHFIDLDGPLLLSEDIQNGLLYYKAQIYPPEPQLWG